MCMHNEEGHRPEDSVGDAPEHAHRTTTFAQGWPHRAARRRNGFLERSGGTRDAQISSTAVTSRNGIGSREITWNVRFGSVER